MAHPVQLGYQLEADFPFHELRSIVGIIGPIDDHGFSIADNDDRLRFHLKLMPGVLLGKHYRDELRWDDNELNHIKYTNE